MVVTNSGFCTFRIKIRMNLKYWQLLVYYWSERKREYQLFYATWHDLSSGMIIFVSALVLVESFQFLNPQFSDFLENYESCNFTEISHYKSLTALDVSF